MTQRIYDSRQQEIVEFQPLVPGRVSMYVCGPTVQSAPHIGHLRSALVYDQLRRWFTATGHEVTLIRNVTDIDDKILENAKRGQEAGGSEEWWALAYRVEREFNAAYDALGVLSPTYEPRATANIQQMIDLISLLIARGHAYQADDGSANVYFATATFPEYGELTRQRLADMADAGEGDARGKRDPRDFALWKAHRESEPASAAWDSPWGKGRPGWHIECSAMATRYLGTQFDMHGGGLDLRFPHHENELAQSRAAGHQFAKHWLHNGLVHTDGQKMSKSLGNSLFAADLLAHARPIVLRYFLGSAHYRSVLEYSPKLLAEAESAFSRIEGFLERAAEARDAAGIGQATASRPAEFDAAMLDDFAIPQALAVLHGTVRDGNSLLAAGDTQGAAVREAEVLAMLDVLGLNPRDPQWATAAGGDSAAAALDKLVAELVAERQQARAERDFATADAIRDRLAGAGIELADTANGATWSIK